MLNDRKVIKKYGIESHQKGHQERFVLSVIKKEFIKKEKRHEQDHDRAHRTALLLR